MGLNFNENVPNLCRWAPLSTKSFFERGEEELIRGEESFKREKGEGIRGIFGGRKGRGGGRGRGGVFRRREMRRRGRREGGRVSGGGSRA